MKVPNFDSFQEQYDGDEVFWMLYDSLDGPTVICCQWFDIPDYEESRFISPKRFAVEEEAQQALQMLPSVENVAKSLRELYHDTDNLSMQYKIGSALKALGYDPVDYLFEEN